jgi:hypothetical protein
MIPGMESLRLERETSRPASPGICRTKFGFILEGKYEFSLKGDSSWVPDSVAIHHLFCPAREGNIRGCALFLP